MAFFEALIRFTEGSHLKQGSRSAIFIAIMDDKVPSRAKLFLVLVLFNPTTENTLFEWGRTRTSLAMVASLGNRLTPVTFKNELAVHFSRH